MANLNAPFGLRPVRHKSGAPYNGACNLYYSTGATALYIGDPVTILGASNQTTYYGSPAGSLPTVGIATAGAGTGAQRLGGVIVGFFPEQATSTVYAAASVGRGVFVADDPDLIFEVQDDGVIASDYTFVGSGGNLVAGDGGSTATGRSSWQLSTTVATSVTDQVKFLRISTRPNNALGAYCVWDVMINNHMLANGVGSIGI